MTNERYQQNSHKWQTWDLRWQLGFQWHRRGIELVSQVPRLFHSATVSQCDHLLLLHMYMYLLFETSPGWLPGWRGVFFKLNLVGGTQLQCIYYLCRILISRPLRVFRRFKRHSCISKQPMIPCQPALHRPLSAIHHLLYKWFECGNSKETGWIVLKFGSHIGSNSVPSRDCRDMVVIELKMIERDGVSNHQCLDCLLNCLFRRRSKKKSKLRITGLCEGNSPVTSEFPSQRASYAENVSIWQRHHESGKSQGKVQESFSAKSVATLTRTIVILPQWAVAMLPQWQCSKPEEYEVSITIMIWTLYGLTLNDSVTVTIESLI